MPDSLKIHCEDGRVLEVPEESAEKLLFLIQTMNSPDAFKSPAFAQLGTLSPSPLISTSRSNMLFLDISEKPYGRTQLM